MAQECPTFQLALTLPFLAMEALLASCTSIHSRVNSLNKCCATIHILKLKLNLSQTIAILHCLYPSIYLNLCFTVRSPATATPRAYNRLEQTKWMSIKAHHPCHLRNRTAWALPTPALPNKIRLFLDAKGMEPRQLSIMLYSNGNYETGETISYSCHLHYTTVINTQS